MTRYLDPQQVADRIGVARRTAMALMMQMNPIAVCGKTRKRYRVTEENLELWMAKHSLGRTKTGGICTGSKRKLTRR